MNESEHERPILTVDIVLLTLHENRLHVALLRRDKPPAEGVLTLVGGYVHVDKDANTLATAQRVLRSKVGLDGIFCEQLMTFSGPTRDSRGWSATVAYYALAPEKIYREATTGELMLMPADAPGDLPFDHKAIVAAALERLRVKGAYSTLPALLLPPSFTLLQLRSIYEQVMGVSLNDSAFRRKIEELQFVEPIEGAKSKLSARPAKLYRLRHETLRAFDRKI